MNVGQDRSDGPAFGSFPDLGGIRSDHPIRPLACLLWAAWLLVGVLRSVLVFERRQREGKLLQDILAGLIYLAAVFGIIAYVFDLPVQGLLATSGAIAIIIGLALQSSLSDVFS